MALCTKTLELPSHSDVAKVKPLTSLIIIRSYLRPSSDLSLSQTKPSYLSVSHTVHTPRPKSGERPYRDVTHFPDATNKLSHLGTNICIAGYGPCSCSLTQTLLKSLSMHLGFISTSSSPCTYRRRQYWHLNLVPYWKLICSRTHCPTWRSTRFWAVHSHCMHFPSHTWTPVSPLSPWATTPSLLHLWN